MNQGAQNMKTGPDTHGTVENESGSTKRDLTPSAAAENESGRTKQEDEKISTVALGTVKKEYGSAKHENGKDGKGTRRPRYRRK
jgi:hypothetical protein